MTPTISFRKSWLVGLVAVTCVNGAAVNLQGRDDAPAPSNEEKCKMPWGQGDADQDKTTWTNSGAEDFLSNFLHDKGNLHWSRDLLTQTVAKGSQGGTQFSCIDIDSTTCGPPQDCLTYEPVEAFFVHTQMANLFAALQKLQTRHIKDAVSAISSDIHQIVDAFGTVQDDGSAAVFKALLGTIGSLTGINSAIGTAGTFKGAAFAGNALSLFSTIVGFGTGLDEAPESAEAVQGKITDKYGQMFTMAMGQINETVKVIFGDKEPKYKRKDVLGLDDAVAKMDFNAVHKYFQDGVWLDPEVFNVAVDIYADNTKAKMLELCLIQAMKDNQQPYYMSIQAKQDGTYQFGGNYDDGMNEDVCGTKKNCHWFDDHCLCFERQIAEGGFVPEQTAGLGDEDVEKMKKWVQDFNGALENNYNCVKDGYVNQDTPVIAGDREHPPAFDLNNPPPDYFKCFWNLNVIGHM